MKIFFSCLLVLWLGSYIGWSSSEIASRTNQIKDLREEINFLNDYIEGVGQSEAPE